MCLRSKINSLSLIDMPQITDEEFLGNNLEEHTKYFIKMFETSKLHQNILQKLHEKHQKAADVLIRFTKRVLHRDNWYKLMHILLNFNFKRDGMADSKSNLLASTHFTKK